MNQETLSSVLHFPSLSEWEKMISLQITTVYVHVKLNLELNRNLDDIYSEHSVDDVPSIC